MSHAAVPSWPTMRRPPAEALLAVPVVRRAAGRPGGRQPRDARRRRASGSRPRTRGAFASGSRSRICSWNQLAPARQVCQVGERSSTRRGVPTSASNASLTTATLGRPGARPNPRRPCPCRRRRRSPRRQRARRRPGARQLLGPRSESRARGARSASLRPPAGSETGRGGGWRGAARTRTRPARRGCRPRTVETARRRP